MIIYKFGGGVLKSAKSIIKLADIVNSYNSKIIVVVSALNKTTSQIETLYNIYAEKKLFNKELFNKIKSFHTNILAELGFPKKHKLYDRINYLFLDFIKELYKKYDCYDNKYDKLVSYGELLSSAIIYEYLCFVNIKTKFCDIRKVIITNSLYRDAKVDWEKTKKYINLEFENISDEIIITQGYIAGDKHGNTTTLGKEGSDFTAAILAYSLNAKKVVFWKEVDGIYNSDPAKFNDSVLLNELSYREGVEQIYFGAKILHPKTIKPLQNKKIPVYVRSFNKLENSGTKIVDASEIENTYTPKVPIFIEKENQILISVSPNDFSFIEEKSLSEIFSLLAKFGIKINLMQNSAISFSFCVDYDKRKIPKFIIELEKEYGIRYNKNTSLVTVRHYTKNALTKVLKNRTSLLVQKSRSTIRYVFKN